MNIARSFLKTLHLPRLLLLAVLGLIALVASFYIRATELIDYKDLPMNSIFLLFPKSLCASGDTCLNRALLVEKAEFDSRTIVYSDLSGNEKTIDRDNLTPIPQGESRQLLQNWERALRLAGYSDGEWKMEPLTLNKHEVRLELTDSRHGRKEMYVYIIEGENIVAGKRPSGYTWIDMATLLCFFVFLFTIVLLCRRRIF